jgi:uncharacterized protein (DUF488 family)
VKLFTIGFTRTTAEEFFAKLRTAGVTRVVDTRIHRDGQLSGFAKMPDLHYFLTQLTSCAYQASASLMPTPELLKSYRDKILTWDEYAYRALLRERRPEREYSSVELDHACLLCSEHEPSRCHRRLAAEHLQSAFAGRITVEIAHLQGRCTGFARPRIQRPASMQ